MTVEEKRKNLTVEDIVSNCENRVIALNGKDGKKMFDTRNNKRDYIAQFYGREVLCIWADVIVNPYGGFNPSIEPVVKCYVSNYPWKDGAE